MRIATWNINGVKARIDGLCQWLADTKPDVVCLQEIKSVDEGFPGGPIGDLGYNIAVHGQKGFNGVAILSRRPIDDIRRGLPGDEADAQARYIEAVIAGEKGVVRVASLYAPNGNPIGTEKFSYKLGWLARLEAHWQALRAFEEPLVLAGDYNIIPTDDDVHDPAAWAEDALFQPESQAAYWRLAHSGLTDALRATTDQSGLYTFWDYQAGAWQKDHGIRIDHAMLSPQAADVLVAAGIDRFTRGWEKPSDHVPMWVELAV